MSLNQAYRAELEQELNTTRRLLERVPTDKFAWSPHAKSYTMGKLATHLAHLPSWTEITLNTSELDLSIPRDQPKPETSEELLALFDETRANALKALETAPESVWAETWTLRAGDHVVFTLPKPAVMRAFVLSHVIHHRGQLSVYLRLNDIPVPSIYGPSADEGIG
jgi:uncharacterized damage-inducible protein DinB